VYIHRKGENIIMQYKTVDTSTLNGLKRAEALKEQGWKIYRTGLFLVYFCKNNIAN